MASDTFDCGTNYLQPTGFKVVISRRDFPNLQFYAQSVNHPDVNIPATEVAFSRVQSVAFVGDKVEYGTLTMDVLLDEDMNSYRELYNWMIAATTTNHRLPTEALATGETPAYSPASYYDMTIAVLSSHNNVNRSFIYRNAFPVAMGQVPFTATSTEPYLTFPVSFRFDYFDFK